MHFFKLFVKRFFQILSRSWGINFDTIACVFELVDDQNMCLFFNILSKNRFFQNICWGPIHSFPTPRSGQKNILKISDPTPFFILSYPILPLLRA